MIQSTVLVLVLGRNNFPAQAGNALEVAAREQGGSRTAVQSTLLTARFLSFGGG